ncbi:MAG: insulinase family protein [Bacteroidales bacterium]|nr:insulinase family protein [Bacteroidales bacterium]
MKRIVCTILMAVTFVVTAFAQQMALPTDPNVRIGKLDNGMSYYIRHNEKPEQRAEFYIAQKVGSILEEENQRGLAHFLEHMCFNGTKNYPGKAMLDYLEKNGVKFGENVNAGTGIEQTVYMIMNVPTTNEGLVDSCMLVLHDWSSFVSLEESEIDKERGVILEELRTRNNAQQRMWEVMLPEMYPNSPYGNRLPGGLPEVIANFDYQTLRDYYHKWYRPDLQGLIIVGDIDVDKIEAKIKTMFADIKAPVNPAERTKFEVADNVEPIVSICSDKEATHYQLMMFYKHDCMPDEMKGDMQYLIFQYVMDMISNMLNNRLDELRQKPNPPFIAGYGYYGNYYVSQTKDAWTGIAIAKDATSIAEALTALVHENNRMQQYGFTASEYERAKADYLKDLENRYNERANEKNGKYVDECLDHFLSNEPMIGIENEFALFSQIVPVIPLETINETVKELVSDSNLVITLTAPEKEGVVLPTKEVLINIVKIADKDQVEPYVDAVSDEPLLAKLPKAGKVKSEKALPQFEATEWTLSNGVKVIYKPTKFKEDEIRMSAYSWGGTSQFDVKDAITIKSLDELITIGGVGNFSAIDLPKILSGKIVNITPYIDDTKEGFTGDCSPKDLETLMQVIYLYFTQPRADQEAFTSFLTRTKAALENMDANPMITFQDSLMAVIYNNHPLVTRVKVADLTKIDYKRAMEMYNDRFANANDFIFTFVGNIDPAVLKTLSEQYLASLPSKKGTEQWKDNGKNPTKATRISRYDKKLETPKTTIFMSYNGDMDYTPENKIYMDVFGDILDIVYTEKIREDEGGTYGVYVGGSLGAIPTGNFFLQIIFDTNEELCDKLMGIAKDELKKMASEGPSEVNLNKVKEFMLKKHQEDLQENKYWISSINDFTRNDVNVVADYEKIVNSITVKSMADFSKMILKGYQKEVIQNGKK